MSRILVIEDEVVIRSALKRLLERNGYEVLEAGSVEEARQLEGLDGTHLVIADLRLPGASGTEAIGLLPEVSVLIMTSYASVRSAVDYIAKPFDHDEMVMTVQRIMGEYQLRRQNRALKSDIERSYPVAGMVGRCPAMQEVFDRIERVAPTGTTVLITGESGTGKELVARAVHEASGRRSAPMITVNCAAIPANLIENELFGHEKGSYTGAVGPQEGVVEAADGGTLFLDEIGELPLEAQARLLRVLQEGEIRRVGAARAKRVDVRLVATTHRDLRALVAEKQFREDLYFRLHVMEIALPALRDRGDDIGELADSLLARSCKRLHKPTLEFDTAAREAIQSYPWPGNVRELEHAIERAVILSDGGTITPRHLSLPEPSWAEPGAAAEPRARTELSLEDYFRAFVEEHQHHMTETELAQRLGISRKALWERRQRLGMPRTRAR